MTTRGDRSFSRLDQREAGAHRFPPRGDPIPTPAAGQLLLEVQYLSLDPYMRGRMNDGKSYAKPLEIAR